MQSLIGNPSLGSGVRRPVAITSACCSTAVAPVPAASCLQRLHQAKRPEVRASGILDSYRREKGLTVDTPAAPSRPPPPPVATAPVGAHPAAPLLDLDVDEDVHFNDDDTPCPVDCVIEVFEPQELQDILDSVSPSTLVVVDFYKTACGACKYILPGFVRLCKQWGNSGGDADVEIDLTSTREGSSSGSSSDESGGEDATPFSSTSSMELEAVVASSSSRGSAAGSSSGAQQQQQQQQGAEEDAPSVLFVKHNVYDDAEGEVTELARKYVIKSVPMFKFFVGGREVDSFATRDKKRLLAALQKHAPGGFAS